VRGFGEERKEEGKGRKEGRTEEGRDEKKTPMGQNAAISLLEFSRRVYYWGDTSLMVLVP